MRLRGKSVARFRASEVSMAVRPYACPWELVIAGMDLTAGLTGGGCVTGCGDKNFLMKR